MKKEVVVCFQALVYNKKFMVTFEDGQKREMSSFSLLYLCQKEEFCLDMEEPISDLTPKEQDKLLTVDEDSSFEEAHMFERHVYFSLFYC